jgi:chromosomal replication initiation ATPase DnaA
MEEHLKNIFRWLEEKYGVHDIILEVVGDLSGAFKDEYKNKDLFMFDNIMDITKEDIDNWDEEAEQNWLNEYLN